MTTSSTPRSVASSATSVGERAPADVRLDPEQQHRVAVGARNLGVVEGVVGPVDLPGDAVDERDVRPRRLEVEELLGVDVGEPGRLPGAREEAGGERGSLAAVVPAPKGGDEDWTAQTRPRRNAELLHRSV